MIRFHFYISLDSVLFNGVIYAFFLFTDPKGRAKHRKDRGLQPENCSSVSIPICSLS